MSHQSRFWCQLAAASQLGKSGSARTIARLEHVVVEQPEQNLRCFDRNLKP